jgi:hypothetical protein
MWTHEKVAKLTYVLDQAPEYRTWPPPKKELKQ